MLDTIHGLLREFLSRGAPLPADIRERVLTRIAEDEARPSIA